MRSGPSEQQQWNTRYATADVAGAEPAEVLAWHSHLLPRRGQAVDLACGLAGNGIFLARRGMQVEAWDFSERAVTAVNAFAASHGLPLSAHVRDVVEQPPALDSFDVVVVSRFLHRPLCAALVAALRPGGLLFYQTFTRRKVTGRGPSNPDFLLADGELLELFRDLQPVIYREERDIGDPASGLRDQAMLVALRAC